MVHQLSLAVPQQDIVEKLTASWIWIQDWIDSSASNTAGRLVTFSRSFQLNDGDHVAAILHISADTRYKLLVNGRRVSVGPARGSINTWYYDTIDIRHLLRRGQNDLTITVLRYFAASRSAMPFVRTAYPGLTIVGSVFGANESVDLGTQCGGWVAHVEDEITFPTGLTEDVFLHINERGGTRKLQTQKSTMSVKPYNIKTLNGELSPWRLQPRNLPMPEATKVFFSTVRCNESDIPHSEWQQFLRNEKSLQLSAGSRHEVEVIADTHSTAFLTWVFEAGEQSHVDLKILYSEGYEKEPKTYPFFRDKGDRLDHKSGELYGPYDDVRVSIEKDDTASYEPFWFRTFRVLQVTLVVGPQPVKLASFDATQVNYPIAAKGYLHDKSDSQAGQVWDVSVRTMRNCMFDAYVDCPFYEQLQYIGDTRTVGLFHYLISGDDRLMRRAISSFAESITKEGLPQSRYPSSVPQIIAGFALYWILMVCDHHLFFGDARYARSLLPHIDGVLGFFESHVDDRGLVSGLPTDVWQFVDWVTAWGATETHPDKGVPAAGRATNTHTYFSLLYAYVLKQAAVLLCDLGRPAVGEEYETRAVTVNLAVRKHCFDGQFFTDSTSDITGNGSYSQHCQVFAVLSGAAATDERARLLEKSFADPRRFSGCSYMMMFYAFRAMAVAGDQVYESYWPGAWDPWRAMLSNNLTTWEEDDVRHRSDCHAWGSVPLYEYCIELAGVHPIEAGCVSVLVKPRLRLSKAVEARVALGADNTVTVNWHEGEHGETMVEILLDRAVALVTQLPGQDQIEHGKLDRLSLVWIPQA